MIDGIRRYAVISMTRLTALWPVGVQTTVCHFLSHSWIRGARQPDSSGNLNALAAVKDFRLLSMDYFSKFLRNPAPELPKPVVDHSHEFSTAWNSVKVGGEKPLRVSSRNDFHLNAKLGSSRIP